MDAPAGLRDLAFRMLAGWHDSQGFAFEASLHRPCIPGGFLNLSRIFFFLSHALSVVAENSWVLALAAKQLD